MAERKKLLPIGTDDFKEIIEKDLYYFDKTGFIENLFTDWAKVHLFTRPRRFGKTLNMSMLKYFFDIRNKEENRKLFKDLKISESKYFEKQGTIPVILMSFRNFKSDNWEEAFISLKTRISMLYKEFRFLENELDEIDKENFMNIRRKKTNADWKESLFNLTQYLYEYYRVKPIILIDEYDSPMIQAYLKNYYDKIISFFSEFYGMALKNNVYLDFGIMTGVLRAAKTNIFSDLNNIKIKSIFSEKFSEYFGLTENEIEQSLKDYELNYELEKVQEWYNGYQFGNSKVYNPWSIINFLSDKKLETHWINTSSNDLIYSQLKNGNPEIFEDLIKLFDGEKIQKKINEFMNFNNLENNSNEIWDLFVNSGYLTIEGKKNETGEYCLKIPNKEIYDYFKETFIEIFSGKDSNYTKITEALEKSAEKLCKLYGCSGKI